MLASTSARGIKPAAIHEPVYAKRGLEKYVGVSVDVTNERPCHQTSLTRSVREMQLRYYKYLIHCCGVMT